ncbi:MAG: competence protein ComEC [Acidimicrobiaceae bacterium]|nr:competence protein ComEC [Acidimicrobiaceae bacterium]
MTDRWTVVLALAAATGAFAARPVALALLVPVAVAALGWRVPALVCVAVGLAASILAARAWAGLDQPSLTTWSGTAVLVNDPARQHGALRFEARVGGRRVEAWARGDSGWRLAPRLAGERVELAGRLRPVTGRSRAYLAHRHIAARLDVQSVGRTTPAPLPLRAANAVRRLILHGARTLPDQTRALFAGFVLGDQRFESDQTRQDFRHSGLSHLLVVSGENVAFVLALAQPALRRLRLGPRFLAALGILGFFGLLTRGEPSVLRAEAMAAIAVLAATLGRPVSTQRLLCLAVTGLVLVDPMLVGSVGFLLSVAATAGIAWLTPPLQRRLPLPVAVAVAAQLGVTPVLIPVFGGLPAASLPANLLALPAAGPVMMWGLAAGLPAGLLPAPIAAVLHLPTLVLVDWVAFVARRAGNGPLGRLMIGGPALAGLLAGVAVARVGWRIASKRAARARSP